MLSVGGFTLDPINYRAAFASSLIPSPLSHWLLLQEAYPHGETTGFSSFTFSMCRIMAEIAADCPKFHHDFKNDVSDKSPE